jgi:hypothetical protein
VREGRQTTELQQLREAETQKKLAEAAQVRAEVQAKQQAEDKEVLSRREMILGQRYFDLLRSVKRLVIASGSGILACVAGLLMLAFPVFNYGLPYGNALAVVSAALSALVLGAAYFAMLLRKYNGRSLTLERQQNAYRIRSGDYAELSDASALLLFSERIESIASGGTLNRSAPPTTAGSGPANPGYDAANLSLSSTAASPPAPSSASRPPPPAAPAESNEPIDVFLDYADGGIVREWMREFTPLLRIWLSESLGRDVRIFEDQQISPGSDWAGTLNAKLLNARAVLVVATPHYFSSKAHLEVLAKVIAQPPRAGLTLITLDRKAMTELPSNLVSQTVVDFSDLAYIGEGFTKSERYVDFQDRVRKLASILADRMKEAPPTA